LLRVLTAGFGTKRRIAATHQFGRYRGEPDIRGVTARMAGTLQTQSRLWRPWLVV